MAERDDNRFVKDSFLAHLSRQGFSPEHLDVYGEYFDFLLAHIGAAKLMDLEPTVIYRAAMASVDELDGEEVVEAYMQVMEFFIEYWSERWEAMHPEDETSQ